MRLSLSVPLVASRARRHVPQRLVHPDAQGAHAGRGVHLWACVGAQEGTESSQRCLHCTTSIIAHARRTEVLPSLGRRSIRYGSPVFQQPEVLLVCSHCSVF